jgi:WD40 repeat protein/serine/threonine protein kinase
MQPGAIIAQRYKIERELGKGGCGAVYVAIDGKFGERVALKLAAASGTDYDAFRARFAREAKLGNKLGKMPGVVRAFDWGTVGQAGLYLAMDLVPDARPLDLTSGTLEERLRRLREAARLVASAHAERVIHRDVKPANFLQGADGRIWLTDFGLAKLQGELDKAADTGLTTLTQRGDVMGTPAFMPPEQFDDVSSVDERADIYALGVMLYLAVGSKAPYEGRSSFELRMKMEGVKNGKTKQPRLATLAPGTPPALDALAARATALDRNERLGTAAEFVAALDAVLDGKKSTAPGSPASTFPALPVLGGVALLAAGVTVALLLGFSKGPATPPPPPTEGSAGVTTATTNGGTSSTVAAPASESVVAPLVTAVETAPPEPTSVVETPEIAPAPPSEEIPDLPKGALARLGTFRLRHGREVSAVAFALDSKTLLTADLWGTVNLWSVPDGAPRDELQVSREGPPLRAIAFSPRGGLVVTAVASGTVAVTSVATKHEITSFAVPPPVFGIAVSPDETLLAVSCAYGVCLRRLDGSGTSSKIDLEPRVTKVAFSPDGALLAAGCDDMKARVFSVPDGILAATLTGHGGPVTAVAFSADGKVLATGSADKTIRLWSVPDGAPLGDPFPAHRGLVSAIALSPDGKWLVSLGNPSVTLWSTERRERAVQALETHGPRAIAFSPDGAWIVAGCHGGGVALFDSRTGERVAPRTEGHTDAIESIAFSADGTTLASASLDHTLEVWDVGWRRGTATLTFRTMPFVHGVAMLPDGRVVSGGGDGVVLVWSGTRSTTVFRPQKDGPHRNHAVAVSADGTLIASARPDSPVALVRLPEKGAAGEPTVTELRVPRHAPWGVAFSPDAKHLASAGADATVRLYSVEGKKVVRTLQAPKGTELHTVAFSPDGKTVAAGGSDGVPRLWKTDTGKTIALELEGHSGFLNALAFSPDGKLLATGGGDRLVRIHDLASGRCVARLHGHRAPVRGVAFSPDGKTLASGSADGTVVLWDVAAVVESR